MLGDSLRVKDQKRKLLVYFMNKKKVPVLRRRSRKWFENDGMQQQATKRMFLRTSDRLQVGGCVYYYLQYIAFS